MESFVIYVTWDIFGIFWGYIYLFTQLSPEQFRSDSEKSRNSEVVVGNTSRSL